MIECTSGNGEMLRGCGTTKFCGHSSENINDFPTMEFRSNRDVGAWVYCDTALEFEMQFGAQAGVESWIQTRRVEYYYTAARVDGSGDVEGVVLVSNEYYNAAAKKELRTGQDLNVSNLPFQVGVSERRNRLSSYAERMS